jgi:hypothetical protein
MGFLPAICRKLLGEELAMPSVGTWWCGEKPALEYVRENFDDLVIKPAYPTQRMDPVFGYELKGERVPRLTASHRGPAACLCRSGNGQPVARADLEPFARASPACPAGRVARLCRVNLAAIR